jgi:sugar phosphate isomerase/epimerase
MRIGCSTITFGPQSREEALERIAELGFRVVDLAAVPGVFDHVRLIAPSPGEAGRVADLVRGHDFEVAGLQSMPWLPDAIDDPEELRRRYEVAADVAVAVHARAWIVDANRPAGDDPSGRRKGLERFKRTITMAAELADARGLRLGVEAPHSGTLAETLPQTLELLEVADLPQLGIDADTSHLLRSGATTAEILDALGHRVIHVALRDVHRSGGWCTPGDGEFDFAEFFRLLRETDYEGDAMLELEPSERHASADARASEAARGRRFLESLVDSLPDNE